MPTTKEYKDFILEKLEMLDNIICKPMIGEYLLYYNGIYFGGICDNRLMVKIVQINKKYMLTEQLPYEGAKPMYVIDDLENKELIKEIIVETCICLANKKKWVKWEFSDLDSHFL